MFKPASVGLVSAMELLKLFLMSLYVAVVFVHLTKLVESTVLVRFDQTPRARSRHSFASFRYSFETLDGSNACQNTTCSIHCQLDGQALSSCPAGFIILKNLSINRHHVFLLNVTTLNGHTNSSAYSWFIDTIPPTATILSKHNYTNAKQIAVDVIFDEACVGRGGFKCLNSSDCDVIINGPARINPNSLRVIEPAVHYRLGISLSTASTVGRAVIAMADNICTDQAGNNFTRSNTSSIIIHIDRRLVLVDFWSAVPSYELTINGALRTVLATNKLEDFKFFLEFTAPVINSTEQVLNALQVNKGSLIPIGSRNQGNRRFAFELNVTSRTQIITVELQTNLIIGRAGSPVSPVSPVTFLYDSLKPGVRLSTSSPNVTKESEINVIVEFTKPVFGFEAAMVKVIGGRISRLKELSRALYSVSIVAEVTHNAGSVTVIVPEGRLSDISGNLNSVSNQLEVRHYSTPSPSIALHSFVTAGILATSLATAILSISFANLGAIDTLAAGSTNIIVSDQSTNLHGMVGHLQVFVLSDWLSVNQPIEYSETAKGLRWLIPHQKLPWKKDTSSVWPNHVYMTTTEEKFPGKFSTVSEEWLPNKMVNNQTYPCLTNTSCARSQSFVPKPGRFYRQYNISMEKVPYGQALDTKEYFIYFLRGEPLSASDVVKRMENYKGWQDLEMNLFWLCAGGGGLVVAHVVLILLLKWRIGTVHGTLLVPRFEIFLIILVLPCIAQSSVFVIRGGTTGGIIAGSLLLAIPAAFILSICLFLVIAIFSASLVQYKEVHHVAADELWYAKLWWLFTARPVAGKWFYREGLPLSFLSRFGILFEALKGPPSFVLAANRYGTGDSVDEAETHSSTTSTTVLLGRGRSSYVVVDLLRRVSLGIIAGAYSPKESTQAVLALSITSAQLTYLIVLKPYISRGVHIVESVSLLCEIAFFGLTISTIDTNPRGALQVGFVMLGLVFVTFVSHIINEWYTLITSLLRLSRPGENSLKQGMKMAAQGFVLPFVSREQWPDQSPEKERRRDPRSAMRSTVVPVLSPIAERNNVGWQRWGEGERKSEMKKLRALARASFSGDSTNIINAYRR